jgi:hypothetical protein
MYPGSPVPCPFGPFDDEAVGSRWVVSFRVRVMRRDAWTGGNLDRECFGVGVVAVVRDGVSGWGWGLLGRRNVVGHALFVDGSVGGWDENSGSAYGL